MAKTKKNKHYGKNKKIICTVENCHNPPYLGGLCEEHHKIEEEEERTKIKVKELLHRLNLDGSPVSEEYNKPLMLANTAWNDAAFIVRQNLEDTRLVQIAEALMENSFQLAKEIYLSKTALRKNENYSGLISFREDIVKKQIIDLENAQGK